MLCQPKYQISRRISWHDYYYQLDYCIDSRREDESSFIQHKLWPCPAHKLNLPDRLRQCLTEVGGNIFDLFVRFSFMPGYDIDDLDDDHVGILGLYYGTPFVVYTKSGSSDFNIKCPPVPNPGPLIDLWQNLLDEMGKTLNWEPVNS